MIMATQSLSRSRSYSRCFQIPLQQQGLVSAMGTTGQFSVLLLVVLIGAAGVTVQPVAAARTHPTSVAAQFHEIAQAQGDSSSAVGSSLGLDSNDRHAGRAMLMDVPEKPADKKPEPAKPFSCADLITLFPQTNVLVRTSLTKDLIAFPTLSIALEYLCICTSSYRSWRKDSAGPDGVPLMTWPLERDPPSLNAEICQMHISKQLAGHLKFCTDKCLCKDDATKTDDSLWRCVIARFFSPAPVGFGPTPGKMFLRGPDLLDCLSNAPEIKRLLASTGAKLQLPKDDAKDKTAGSCTGALVAEVKADEKALKTAEKEEEKAAKDVKDATKDLVADTKVLSDAMKGSDEKTDKATSTEPKVVNTRQRTQATPGGIAKPGDKGSGDSKGKPDDKKSSFEDADEEGEGYGGMPRQSRYADDNTNQDSGFAPHLSSSWYEDDGEGGANHQQPATSQQLRYADDEDQGASDRFAPQQLGFTDNADEGEQFAPQQFQGYEDYESDGDDK